MGFASAERPLRQIFRVERLRSVNAPVRFVSAEPLLGTPTYPASTGSDSTLYRTLRGLGPEAVRAL